MQEDRPDELAIKGVIFLRPDSHKQRLTECFGRFQTSLAGQASPWGIGQHGILTFD